MSISIQKISFIKSLTAPKNDRNSRLRNTKNSDSVRFGVKKVVEIDSKKLASACAVLAGKAYPQGLKAPLPEGFRLVSSNRSGKVFSKTFLNNREDTCVVAYSGTYNVPEFVENAISFLTNLARDEFFTESDKLFLSAKKQFPKKNFIVVGHSAGGGLAQYVAAKNDTYALSYAPAGIGRLLEPLGLSKKEYKKIVNYVASSDPVTAGYENIGRVFELPINMSHNIRNYLNEDIYNKRRELEELEITKIGLGEFFMSQLDILRNFKNK